MGFAPKNSWWWATRTPQRSSAGGGAGGRAGARACWGEGPPNPFPALAPEGALQGLLAGRIARAAWRLERAERIEAELFARHAHSDRDLGLALIRDCNGTRAFDTLLRYRGTALAELWRALRLLKALQAEAAVPHAPVFEAEPAAQLPAPQADAGATCQQPIEPEGRRIPGENAPVPPTDAPKEALGWSDADDFAGMRRAEQQGGISAVGCPAPAPRKNPIEPEARRNPGAIAPARAGDPGLAPDHARRNPQIASGRCPSRGPC
jgi:hypothetical protein